MKMKRRKIKQKAGEWTAAKFSIETNGCREQTAVELPIETNGCNIIGEHGERVIPFEEVNAVAKSVEDIAKKEPTI